jgi:hypothetical protein
MAAAEVDRNCGWDASPQLPPTVAFTAVMFWLAPPASRRPPPGSTLTRTAGTSVPSTSFDTDPDRVMTSRSPAPTMPPSGSCHDARSTEATGGLKDSRAFTRSVVVTSGRLVALVQYTVSTSSADSPGSTGSGSLATMAVGPSTAQHTRHQKHALVRRGNRTPRACRKRLAPRTPGQHAVAPGLEPSCSGHGRHSASDDDPVRALKVRAGHSRHWLTLTAPGVGL